MVKPNDPPVDIIDTIPELLCWTWISIVGGLVLVTLNAFWMGAALEPDSFNSNPTRESRRKVRMMKLHAAPSAHPYSTSGALGL